jgi:hypothetical protein
MAIVAAIITAKPAVIVVLDMRFLSGQWAFPLVQRSHIGRGSRPITEDFIQPSSSGKFHGEQPKVSGEFREHFLRENV